MAVRLYSFVLAAALAVLVESRGIADQCDVNWAYHFERSCGRDVSRFRVTSSTEIQEILNVHASFGETLSWSDALANRAQSYVNQCPNSSNPCSVYNGAKISVVKEDSESSVSFTDMIKSVFDHENFHIPQMNIPDNNVPEINISDINIPEINISDINIPEINMSDIQVTDDMDLTKIDMTDIDFSEWDLPASDLVGADLANILSTDKNNAAATVGCGFIMSRTQRGFSKHLACFYGDKNGQGFA